MTASKIRDLRCGHIKDVRVTVQEFWLPYDEYQPALF